MIEAANPTDSNQHLHTEYLGDIDDETSSEEINRWIENALVCLTFLVLLSLREYVPFSAFYLLVPLLLSNLKQAALFLYKSSAFVALFGKSALICEAVALSANLTFYICIPLLWGKISTPVLASPLALEAISKIVLRWYIRSECLLLSELVRVTQVFNIHVVVKAITAISFGLKFEGFGGFTWVSVFWPCWILASFMSIVSLGMFLLFIGTLCTRLFNETDSIEIVASAWMFFSSIGVPFSLSLFLLSLGDYMEKGGNSSLESFNPKIFYIEAYLLMFVGFTVLKKSELA